MKSIVIEQKYWTYLTEGRGPIEITRHINHHLSEFRIDIGVCTVFLEHTSASLLFCENADPSVLVDLSRQFAEFAPEHPTKYTHAAEGIDDMPAHIRTVFTQNSLTIPVTGGALALGRWQGVFLWEHRRTGHRRQVSMTVYGRPG